MGGRLVEGTTDGPIDDDRTLLYDAAGADDDGTGYSEYSSLGVDNSSSSRMSVRANQREGRGVAYLHRW